MKAIEIKKKTSRSNARVSLPEFVYRPIEALSDALGCRESEIIIQLANHRPGNELELVGKGGFTISLNIPLTELTRDQIQSIHDARMGDESAEEEIAQAKAPEAPKVSMSEKNQAETVAPKEKQEEEATGSEPKKSAMASSILEEMGEENEDLDFLDRSFSDDEE